ncbi:MAG: ankyrin repeat domain-containing protein [Armatimonadetes bacterium]|nr:ankyrin repeat domain-containing protein [Armatimonadota bacterium]
METLTFEEAKASLHRGDYSALDPLFAPIAGSPSQIEIWLAEGRFDKQTLDEALSCACFNGRMSAVLALLAAGGDPSVVEATGCSAFHWAADRGQLEVVKLLIERGTPMEMLNRFGGTVLGFTVWSAAHEPRPHHLEIIERLIKAGAKVERAQCPSGRADVDALLSR